jgi:hypothetical protein
MIQILVGAASERPSRLDAALANNRRNAVVERLSLSIFTERGAVDLNAIGSIAPVLSRTGRKREGHVYGSPVASTGYDSLQALDIDAGRQATNSTFPQWRRPWTR